MAKIFSTGKLDISFWYRFWEAVVAVFSVCVRRGEGGVFRGIGNFSLPLKSHFLCDVPQETQRKARVEEEILTLYQENAAIYF